MKKDTMKDAFEALQNEEVVPVIADKLLGVIISTKNKIHRLRVRI